MGVMHGADHPEEFVFGDAAGAVAAAVGGEYRQATLGFGEGSNQVGGGNGAGAKAQVRPPNTTGGFAPEEEIHAWRYRVGVDQDCGNDLVQLQGEGDRQSGGARPTHGPGDGDHRGCGGRWGRIRGSSGSSEGGEQFIGLRRQDHRVGSPNAHGQCPINRPGLGMQQKQVPAGVDAAGVGGSGGVHKDGGGLGGVPHNVARVTSVDNIHAGSCCDINRLRVEHRVGDAHENGWRGGHAFSFAPSPPARLPTPLGCGKPTILLMRTTKFCG